MRKYRGTEASPLLDAPVSQSIVESMRGVQPLSVNNPPSLKKYLRGGGQRDKSLKLNFT